MSHIYPDPIAGPAVKLFAGMPATYNQQAEAAMLQATIPMTLRDYFAAAALKGQAHRLSSPYEYRDILAADCYAIADAMLKARGGAK